MHTLIEIKKELHSQMPFLKGVYGVKELGIFGSYVRNEMQTTSDLDVLVDFYPESNITLLKLINLENYLTDTVGIQVDLAMKDGLKKELKHIILNEVEFI